MSGDDRDRVRNLLRRAAAEGESIVAVLREFRGTSQEELSRRTGIPQARIVNLESGGFSLEADEANAIAFVLDVPIDLLLE